MRTMLLLLGLAIVAIQAGAADFSRGASFNSVAAFMDAARAFQPAASQSDFSALFTVRELGQSEDPKTGMPVAAVAIQSATILWSDDVHAFAFVTAAPPTEATRSAVGVLFLLTCQDGSWRVVDTLRFGAVGKEAEVSAELTAEAGTGYCLGGGSMTPVITVKESQGGRGYSYQSSASYTFNATKIERLELN